MSIVRFQQAIAEESMVPPRAPFVLRTWGASPFPTPLHADRPGADL
jgi:hypothetical protein